MKHFVPFFATAVLATACNSKPVIDAEATKPAAVSISVDTAGLAQFQAWKAQHELATVAAYKPQQAAVKPAKKTVRKSTPARRVVSHPIETTQSGTLSSESANTAKAPEKKGWSKAAKGAAVGAGTGAVIGAVVHRKNRVVGGVIGGVAGGAVGYGIGRHIDKRDGRY